MKVTLKEIATISAGQNAPQGDKNYCNDGKPFVKAGNLQELIGGGDIKNIQKVSHKVAEEYRLKLFQKGTILFAKSGMSCMKGLVYVLPQDSYVVNHLACITPNQNLSEYLKFYFLFNKPNRLIKDSAYPSISLTDISNIEIEIEENEKREKIVNQLNNLRCSIKLMNNIIAKYDDLVKAQFVEMFGDPKDNPYEWEEVNISEVVGGKVSNGFFAKRDEYTDDGNISVLGVANIVNRMYSKIDNLPRTNANDKDIEKFEVKYGDMLFCRSSLVAEGIGKASIVPENVQEKVLFECHVIRLPLNLNKCVPEYMQLLSTTDYFRTQVISHSKTATMTTIGQDGILSTSIILPPIDKQREFYCFIKQVDKSKFIQMNSTI